MDTWDSSNTGTRGIPLDSPKCPTWDSRMGQTGMVGPVCPIRYTVDIPGILTANLDMAHVDEHNYIQ